MVGLTYATYVTALSELMVIDAIDPDFVAILPNIIDYAEQRMYRELDLLDTVVRDSSSTLTTGTRTFNLPTASGRIFVTNGFNVITPSSATNPDLGTRNQLAPTSRDVLDVLWPSTTGAGVPSLFAMITDQQIIVGPFPDATYTVEVIGTIRPAPLSATNTTTYLSQYLPDAFLQCSMIFGAGYQKNFSAQSDNQGMSVSYETQYKSLMQSADLEEQRKRYSSSGWGSLSPSPAATPSR